MDTTNFIHNNKIVVLILWIFLAESRAMTEIKVWKRKYWPSVTWVRKERMTVGSNAAVTDWPKMLANVKNMVPTLPINQRSAENWSRDRSFWAEVESFPSVSSRRNAIANSVPTTAKLAEIFRNLLKVTAALISGSVIYSWITFWHKAKDQLEPKRRAPKVR